MIRLVEVDDRIRSHSDAISNRCISSHDAACIDRNIVTDPRLYFRVPPDRCVVIYFKTADDAFGKHPCACAMNDEAIRLKIFDPEMRFRSFQIGASM